MRRISIGSWAYTIGPYESNPVGFDEVCERLQGYGFDGVELGAFGPHPNPDTFGSREQRAALRQKVADHGMAFSGLAADLWGEQLINTEDAAPYVANFTKHCDFAVDLGIGGVRIDCVQPPTIFEEVDYDTALGRVVDTWQTCCDVAAERGLYVTWEFEPGFAFNRPSDVVRVHDGVGRSNFGLMYDTSHGQMVAVVGARHPGEPEILPGGQRELVSMLSGRINHIHLIDSDNTCHKDENGEDETSMHVPFGSGVVDFDSIVPALAAESLSHDWWTIDLCFWPNAWEATETCKAAIDDLNRRFG